MAARLTAVKTYTEMIGFNDTPAQKKRLQTLAAKRGVKPSVLLREALAAYLDANQAPARTRPRKALKRPQKAS